MRCAFSILSRSLGANRSGRDCETGHAFANKESVIGQINALFELAREVQEFST